VRKVVRDNVLSNNKVTDYANGFQYENNIIQFFPTAEGYASRLTTKFDLLGRLVKIPIEELPEDQFTYVYNYTDHLGNIRLSYAQDPDTQQLKIVEQNHYYPFGLRHTNYSGGKMQVVKEQELKRMAPTPEELLSYKYKYNGKEWQDELGLNMYDYGARNYDAAIGRWMNVDPLAEQGRRWSPFCYAMDNPIYFIDPDGMWVNPGQNNIIKATYIGPQNMTTTIVGEGYSNYSKNDIGRNRDRNVFPGVTKREHTHLLPTSDTNTKGSSTVLSENISGSKFFGSVTNSVSLTNSSISGTYYNSKGEVVSNISEATSYVVKKSSESLTVEISPTGNGVSNTVNVVNSTTTTTYGVTGNSGMDLFGGRQLANPKTVNTTSNSTMELSAAPDTLKEVAKLRNIWNGEALPNPAGNHIDSTVERTMQQEVYYNESEINNEHRKYR
jgi:RHS repeat-associated protein